MKNVRWLSLLLALVLLLTATTACGKKKEKAKKDASAEITSLAQAKEAIENGDYEAAYLYLQTDNSEEARELKSKLYYVPVKYTGSYGDTTVTGLWTYDDKGHLISEKVTSDWPEDAEYIPSGAGHVVDCTYDGQGNLTSLTIVDQGPDGEEETRLYTYTYDAAGNKLTYEYTDPDGGVYKAIYTYDTNGNELSYQYTYPDGDWNKYTYTYDADGNRLTQDYISSGGSWSKDTYTYDAHGNKLTSDHTASDGSWSKYAYTYDTAGNRLTQDYTDSDGSVNKRRYSTRKDDFGNPIETYVYDKSYRAVTDSNTYETIEKGCWKESERFYDEDTLDLLVEYVWTEYLVEVPDGFGGVCESGGEYSLYTCDDKGNYLTYREGLYHKYGSKDFTAFDFGREYVNTYDDNGRLLTQKVNEVSVIGVRDEYTLTTYTYDDAGRVLTKKWEHFDWEGELTDVTNEAYTYDADGNVLTKETRDANGEWEKTTSYYRGGYRYFYVKEYEHEDGSYRKCTFDEAGNVLTEETGSDGEITKTEYTYDKNGYCLSKKHTKADGSWYKETTDAAGNLLGYEDDSGNRITVTWELRYFPDGVPELVGQVLEACDDTVRALRQNIFSAYGWMNQF